jgi:hypothetical protein
MGMFSWLDPSSGYGAAQNQLNKYWAQEKGFLSPYATAGNNVLPQLMSGASSLMNPEQMQTQWINSYQESPEAKQLAAMTQQNGMGAASSMGLLGSSPATSAITEATGNVVARDRQNYLTDLMNKYTLGMSALRGIYSGGEQSAAQLGQLGSQMGQNSAEMAYGKGSADSSMFYGLLGKFIASQGGGGGTIAPVASAIAGAGGGF